MKGRTVFERMTDVSDRFLEEAAFVPKAGTVLISPRRQKGNNWFARFASSGWGVACICFVVAIAAVVGMVAWGRMGDLTDPSHGGNTSQRFAYSYELFRYDGEALDGAAEPGEKLNLTLYMQNNGSPFFMRDKDLDGITVSLVSQKDDSIVWKWERQVSNDRNGFFWVSAEDSVAVSFSLRIPGTAKAGVYDLVISYENCAQTFKDAVKVEGNSLVFVTYYEKRTTVFEKGQRFSVFVSLQSTGGGGIVIRDGVFQECTNIAFIHVSEDGTEYRLLPESVEFYQPSSSRLFTFLIPADAPAGSYDLYLEAPCHNETHTCDMTVAETGEDVTVQIAAGAIRNAYGRSIDLSAYTAEIEPLEDGGCTVTFRIYIEGLTGGHYYTAEVGSDGRGGSTLSSGGPRLDPFVGIVTPEMLQAAMERLGVTDKTQLELTVDIDRYLLLVYHEYDGDGNIVDYRTERVCRAP